MKIDLRELLEKQEILGLKKGTLLEEFNKIFRVPDNEKIYYTDDKNYFSFIVNWNEFFFEENKLSSINIDLSNNVFLKNENYKFNKELDLNSFISYMNFLGIDWKFYSDYCIMRQLCISLDSIKFFFVQKENQMIINKVKIFE